MWPESSCSAGRPGLLARRGRDGEGFHASGLCGNGVHDHGGGIYGLAARHIQADALNRHPAFGHTSAISQIRIEVLRHLALRHGAGAAHGFLDSGADFRVKRFQSVLHRFCRNAKMSGAHAIELLAEVAQCGGTASLHIVENRTYQVSGFGSAHCGTRHRGQQFGTGEVLAPKVNDSHNVFAHSSPVYVLFVTGERHCLTKTQIVRQMGILGAEMLESCGYRELCGKRYAGVAAAAEKVHAIFP